MGWCEEYGGPCDRPRQRVVHPALLSGDPRRGDPRSPKAKKRIVPIASAHHASTRTPVACLVRVSTSTESLEDESQCVQIIIGATPEGKKELLGSVDGARESAHDWRALLLDLKRRGPSMSPSRAQLWKAIGEIWSNTRAQRCWVHRTANILRTAGEKSKKHAAARSVGRVAVSAQVHRLVRCAATRPSSPAVVRITNLR
jgi:Transposase, Mutator family